MPLTGGFGCRPGGARHGVRRGQRRSAGAIA